MRYLIVLVLFLPGTGVIAQSTPGSIANQKRINGSYVSDPDAIVDAVTIGEIDTVLASLERTTTVQVAVVVVRSIGENDIFEFAQALFNDWGIGGKEADNGLLILMVEDQHTIRFHTGEGVEGVLPDAVCKRIQRDHMVPEFRKGNYSAGLLAGVQQVAKILTDPQYAEELREPAAEEGSDWVGFVTFLFIFVAPPLLIIFIIKAARGKFSDSRNPDSTPYPELQLTRRSWLLQFAAVPIVIIALFGISNMEDRAVWCVFSLYFYFLLTVVHRWQRSGKVIDRLLKVQDYHEIVEFLRSQQGYWLLMAVVFPLPFVFYFFYHLISKRTYRNHPRSCKQCRSAMFKLTEKEEEVYLSEAQQMEETLRSIDYDVWKCTACASVEYWFYLKPHTRYSHCPECNTMAYYSLSKHTVTNPTYSSSGSGEEVHACKFCGHQKKSSYSIPRLTRGSTSGHSGSGSGFSSSSSGGSWGGGSSGGGGASSKW